MPVPAPETWRRLAVAVTLLAAIMVAAPKITLAKEKPAAAPFVATGDDADTFYCKERRLGYWFYCARPEETEDTADGAATPRAASAVEKLDAITAELRELKARAIIEPTPDNVADYIRFQRRQLDQAALFSDVWQRAIWQDPELDYTLQRPVSALGKRQWQDARKAERDAAMRSLSQRYGLFYFFAQGCGACEVMSPIVRSVTTTWNIAVRAISTDGGPSKQFPDYTVETDQRARMGLEPRITPALVLWDAQKQRAIPIGYGVMSADELQDRIYLLTSKDPGHDF